MEGEGSASLPLTPYADRPINKVTQKKQKDAGVEYT